MAASPSTNPRPVALEDLNALNDEIASLVRAGVPLEIGLQGLGSNLRGKLAKLADELATRLGAGQSLADVVATEGGRFPPVYAAVIEAGLRARRLPEALEALTAYSGSIVELRRKLVVAMLYPAVVVILAFTMMVAFVEVMIPVFQNTFYVLEVPSQRLMWAMGIMHDSVRYWGMAIPGVFLLLVLCSRYQDRRIAGGALTGGGLSVLAWLPGIRAVRSNFHLATFSELTSLLVDHQVPLHNALRLAGQATPSAAILHATEEAGRRLESGKTLSESLAGVSQLPPFLRWMMITGESQGMLVLALKQMADVYQRRALNRAEWLKILVPVLLLVVVGGGVTLAYSLMVFVPMAQLLKGLNG